MTSVEFHTGVPDPIDYACRLLRKAYRRGLRVLVTAPEALLSELDRRLWTFDERDFVPHALVQAGSATPAPHLVARTPIWLATQAAGGEVPALVLNVDAAAPADLRQVERLIEIVGAEPEPAERGRARWRVYRAAGLEVVHHVHGTLRE
jgi:DNA polymerase-3 subunit chi